MMGQERNTNSIFVFIICFTLAILFSSFFFISPTVGLFFFLLGLTVSIAEKIWKKVVTREVLIISLVLISFGLGSLRYAVKDFHTLDPVLENQVGKKMELLGVVVSEPAFKDNTTGFILKTETEKILVNTDLYSQVQYGDEVKVKGSLEKPGVIEDGNGGRPFDYGAYLSKDNIYYTLSFAEVEIISRGHGYALKRELLKIKHVLVTNIREILPEPESSLLAGLIVSGKSAMPKSVLEEFRRSGVVHIVVLSGYNITIVADFLRKFFETAFLTFKFSFLPIQAGPQLAAGASIIGIIFFVLMTGGEATVVRAALMVFVVIAAKLFGKTYSAPRALLVAAFLMIVQNPKILVFDPSFQLSFLATCALIYVVPIVEIYLKWISEKWGMRAIIATTIATQIAVLPFLIYSMGNLSLVSLPANILILLFIPTTMFLGFFSAILVSLSQTLALPFAFITHLLLSWILGVSSYLGNLPFASIKIQSFSFFWVLILYFVLIFYICNFSSKNISEI